VGGPNKVILNTIKGLEKIGYPFVINKDIRQFRYNWIHDSMKGLIEVALNRIPAVVGPNLVVLPNDLPRFLPKLSNCIYLYPSQWCIDLWKEIGFSDCPLVSWPAGIDTKEFDITQQITDRSDVMIYFKKRNPVLLDQAVSTVIRMGLNPRIIRYGDYNEVQYKETLASSRFGIWIGLSESQGIGLQEALASGVPLIVCDVNSLFETGNEGGYKFPEKLREFKPTSVPYFDQRCGIIINDFSRLEDSVTEMLENIPDYNPREYILENLSLEKQALELLSFFDLLDNQQLNVYAKTDSEKLSGKFKSTFFGNIIYIIFLVKRKTRTFFNLSLDRFRKFIHVNRK
jgi:hypothetical protein